MNTSSPVVYATQGREEKYRYVIGSCQSSE
jgi:hypothetical protein